MMTSYIWHCFCTYCTKNTGVYYISALSCHTTPVGHNSVLSKTKSIRPRLRPRPKLQDQDQDRGRSETSLVIRPGSQTPRLGTSLWPLDRGTGDSYFESHRAPLVLNTEFSKNENATNAIHEYITWQMLTRSERGRECSSSLICNGGLGKTMK